MLTIQVSRDNAGYYNHHSASMKCEMCRKKATTTHTDKKDADNKRKKDGRSGHLLSMNPGWKLFCSEEGDYWETYCPDHRCISGKEKFIKRPNSPLRKTKKKFIPLTATAA